MFIGMRHLNHGIDLLPTLHRNTQIGEGELRCNLNAVLQMLAADGIFNIAGKKERLSSAEDIVCQITTRALLIGWEVTGIPESSTAPDFQMGDGLIAQFQHCKLLVREMLR